VKTVSDKVAKHLLA